MFKVEFMLLIRYVPVLNVKVCNFYITETLMTLKRYINFIANFEVK